jgi:uncharacterized protein
VQDWFHWSATVIAALKAHQQEIRTAGVEGVSLFGSVARAEDSAKDVDLAVRLGENFSAPGLNYFSCLSQLEGRLSSIPGCKVDVIEEPVRKKRFQMEIDWDAPLQSDNPPAAWQTSSRMRKRFNVTSAVWTWPCSKRTRNLLKPILVDVGARTSDMEPTLTGDPAQPSPLVCCTDTSRRRY